MNASDIHGPKSPLNAVEVFIREKNIELLERALRAEVDPDARRIIRRLLREQERSNAAATRQEQ